MGGQSTTQGEKKGLASVTRMMEGAMKDPGGKAAGLMMGGGKKGPDMRMVEVMKGQDMGEGRRGQGS